MQEAIVTNKYKQKLKDPKTPIATGKSNSNTFKVLYNKLNHPAIIFSCAYIKTLALSSCFWLPLVTSFC